MDLLPNWSLSYDPTIYNTKNTSYGLAAKYRVDISAIATRIIGGLDFDYSPGSRLENRLSVTREGSIYTSYTVEEEIYNYDVRFQEVAPYVQLETSVATGLKVTGGLRFDIAGYQYETHLAAVDTGNWRVPPGTSTSYNHVSPKIGATYDILENLNIFAAYNHGFRVPSEGQLFRQGSSVNTIGLKPVKVDNYEAGLRGRIANPVTFDLSVYTMTKRDDVLTYVNPSNGLREAVNAGETSHWGIELGLGVALLRSLKMDIAYSHGRHTYEDWVLSSGTSYSGKEMEIAPRDIGNVRLTYGGELGHVGMEMVYLGSYWMDPANTRKYAGHTLLNVDLGAFVLESLEISLKVRNLLDRRYAESSSYNAFRGEEFAPGNPRTFIGGISYALR
jgi:outer membrane receptor protein involved in Fe transport